MLSRRLNVAPTPNRVSAFECVRQFDADRWLSVPTGRSSTVSFMRQAMSTPTAYGMTAFSRRQHAADRQAVADVRVRHQRAGDRHWQLAGVPHLLKGVRLETRSPDLIWRVARPRSERAGRDAYLRELTCVHAIFRLRRIIVALLRKMGIASTRASLRAGKHGGCPIRLNALTER